MNNDENKHPREGRTEDDEKTASKNRVANEVRNYFLLQSK